MGLVRLWPFHGNLGANAPLPVPAIKNSAAVLATMRWMLEFDKMQTLWRLLILRMHMA